MSAVLMYKGTDSIIALADGGYFKSRIDLTVTGIAPKLILLPHCNAVIGALGSGALIDVMAISIPERFASFDDLVMGFAEAMPEVLDTAKLFQPFRKRWTSQLFIGGISDRRGRAEIWSLSVDGLVSDSTKAVGRMTEVEGIAFLPDPDFAWLEEIGAVKRCDDGSLDFRGELGTPTDPFIAILRAMRRMPTSVGDENAPEPDDAVGCTVAGFIEYVSVARNACLARIVWRWPDKLGALANPADEGEYVA